MAASKQSMIRQLIRREWLLLAVGAGLAFVIGCLGFFEDLTDSRWFEFFNFSKQPDFSVRFSSAYYALQMLVLNAPYSGKSIPWILEAGRWLAALVFFWATCKFVLLLLRRDFREIMIFREGHVVICGLGNLGLEMAAEAVKKAQKENHKSSLRPVAIEMDPAKESVAEALRMKIPVVIGDAANGDTLRRAKAQQASQVFALCNTDKTNITLAVELGLLKKDMKELKKRRTECWLFIGNPQLRACLQRHNVFPHQDSHYQVNVRGLDVNAVRARSAFAALPLEHLSLFAASGKRPRLILMGFGEMGQSLAVHAAHLAHFPSCGLLHVLVVDEEANKKVEAFRQQVPNLDKVMDIDPITDCLEKTETRQRLVEAYHTADTAGELLACAVCHDGDDARNLSVALHLLNATTGSSPVLVYFMTRKGFAQLEPGKGQDAHYNRFQPFGMLEEVWKLEVLQDEQQDKLARSFHRTYLEDLKRREKKGEDIQGNPANKEWEQLDETFKNANRALADHLRIKLYTVGLKMIPSSQCEPKPLNYAQIEVLSEMEHARWCAERWLDGWIYGPKKDVNRKMHPLLLPWNELSPEARQIDKEMMSKICTIFSKIGYGIVSLSDSGSLGSQSRSKMITKASQAEMDLGNHTSTSE